jgi:NodT family efflux transporter outer membrane factor (OMF) lipoprotein
MRATKQPAGALRAILLVPLLVVPATLAGCTVGPDFHPPADQAPARWWGGAPTNVSSTVTYGGTVDTSWWDSFHDPELSSLVGRLARQNLELQVAGERVEQARQQRRIAASRGLPNIDAQGNYNRVRLPPQVLSTFVMPKPTAPESFDLFQDDLSASWEVDLFGRVRRQVEAERANTEATIETRQSVALMAISDLAQDYMQLRGTQAMEAITTASIADADANTALVRNQFANGVSTTLDMANAQAQRDSIAANLPPLRAAEAQLINAIGLLLAEPPRALEAELQQPAGQPPVPPTVPIGLPSELARRRPDIRAAEARLHAATAATGVAVADFYPDVRLTGQIGTQALRFPELFNLMSGMYMVGPSVDLPIFEGGRLRATLRLRRSEQREAAISYHSTVLQAWQDVDNALTAYTEAQNRRRQIANAVQQNKVALAAARQRYQQGVVDYLNVLAAQDALFQTENSLADSDAQIETDLVTLYRALGGGWQVADGS